MGGKMKYTPKTGKEVSMETLGRIQESQAFL